MLLQDVGRELVLHVARLARAAREAVVVDYFMFDLVGRLRELAGGTQHELLDVHAEFILQDSRLMSAVHDRPLRIIIVRRLSAQFTPKKLRHLAGRAVQRRRDVDHIRDRRLDAVAAALDLADDARHLVAVFRVVDGLGARYIYYLSHGLDLYRDYCC